MLSLCNYGRRDKIFHDFGSFSKISSFLLFDKDIIHRTLSIYNFYIGVNSF